MKRSAGSHQKNLEMIRQMPEVLYAEPNYIYTINGGSRNPATPPPTAHNPEDDLPTVFPNDPSFSKLWGMRNDTTVGADIAAVNAWAINKGSRNVIVGIVDTGVDYTHPELAPNMWSMPGRPEVHGYNAINDSLDPIDDESHGTHVAGTIGARGGNGQGVTGVNWQVSIMALKFLRSDGSGSLSDAIKAIDWGVAHGARVLNNSWGGGGYAQSLYDSIDVARKAGVLFVAAAGNTNGGNDNDRSPTYPASYALDNIISVAATTSTDGIASFSHYGKKSVHLGAPGEGIYSTKPGNSYQSLSGTSMACPHVTGAAALLLSNNPSLSYKALKDSLLSSVDPISSLKNKTTTGGRLNVYRALAK
jgi:subtilisin family serine protease